MNEVLKILNEIRPEFDFSTGGDFFGRGMLDSFDLTSLVSALEQRYEINIDAGDILPQNFSSLDSVTALLKKYGAEAAEGA
jgi:acyl carrier protein